MKDYQDLDIECIECGLTFKVTASGQRFFERQGYELPKRCYECRKKKKARWEHKERTGEFPKE